MLLLSILKRTLRYLSIFYGLIVTLLVCSAKHSGQARHPIFLRYDTSSAQRAPGQLSMDYSNHSIDATQGYLHIHLRSHPWLYSKSPPTPMHPSYSSTPSTAVNP